jgi:hypothetical protein
MISLDFCCYCVDLELGGKLWGFVGVVLGVLSMFRVFSATVVGFQVCKFLLIVLWSFLIELKISRCFCGDSWRLRMLNHDRLDRHVCYANQRYRSGKKHIQTFLFKLLWWLILFSHLFLSLSLKQRLHEKIQPARIVAILEYIFAVIYVIYLMSEYGCKYYKRLTEYYGLEVHDETKVAFAILILGFAVIDFTFRFLVIDSLYRLYQEKPFSEYEVWKSFEVQLFNLKRNSWINMLNSSGLVFWSIEKTTENSPFQIQVNN